MRVTIFDYGAGNLHSLQKALTLAVEAAGRSSTICEVRVDADPLACLSTDVLVLPGVGAFGHAASRLQPACSAVSAAVRDGLPVIGICLGMQLLFDASEEGPGAGLGLISGRVERLRISRVPQIGWNELTEARDDAAVRAGLRWVYYANSFVAAPRDGACVTAWSCVEGERFPGIVRSGTALGVQFHPEKSSAAGVRFLAAALAECGA
jgi:glutamine amidotransferase